MALDQSQAPICWAELANTNRSFPAFKWENGVRVPSKDSRTGAQLYDRRPLQAHTGNMVTGVHVAPIKPTVKILRGDGIEVEVRINNAAAHEGGMDDRYQFAQLAKHRHYGGIVAGECPAMLVQSGVVAAFRILADDARDGRPCNYDSIGPKNPPCRHYVAEFAARLAASRSRNREMIEAFKSEEARTIEAQAKVSMRAAESTTKILESQAETQSLLVAAVAQLAGDKGKGK
jgi:hypothetical protein